MGEDLFGRLSAYIEATVGIRMPPEKRIMLQARLMKRMRKLGHSSYQEYADFAFSRAGAGVELPLMIESVTTNLTDFFREPVHFDFLVQTGLGELIHRFGKRLRFWSAGCATGQEAYSLAMVLEEYRAGHPGFDFEIVGSDLSTTALEVARRAVYSKLEVGAVPMSLSKKYLVESVEHGAGSVRVAPELTRRVEFRRLNFMDEAYAAHGPFHLVMCRNMLIYFHPQVQERVVRRIATCVRPGGYLFIGHVETLSQMKTPFIPVKDTIYQLPAPASPVGGEVARR